MKRKIRLMAMLWPVIYLFFMCAEARAQDPAPGSALTGVLPDDIKPLQIGDTIPEYLWHQVFKTMGSPDGDETLRLMDFRGKLLFIDFWATWCSPCLTSLSKFQTLQEQFDGQLAVIPATYETGEIAKPVFAKHNLALTSVVEDTLLKRTFPHHIIPHVVWIYNNRVQAITGSHLVVDSAINVLLTDGAINLPEKVEVTEVVETNDTYTLFQSQLTRYQPGLTNMHNRISRSRSEIHITNKPIWNMYSHAVKSQVSYGSPVVFDLPDSLKNLLTPPEGLSALERESWRRVNSYCYKLNLSINADAEQLADIMLTDLNRYFGLSIGIKGNLEYRSVECYTLSLIDQQRLKRSNGGQPTVELLPDKLQIKNQPLGILVATLAYRYRSLPFIDITGVNFPVDLDLDAPVSDISNINRSLRQYGLEIRKQHYEIPVLVFDTI